MSAFTFALQIDYEKLSILFDNFLKTHDKELTGIVGQCLTIQKGDGIRTPATTTNNAMTSSSVNKAKDVSEIPCRDAKGNGMTYDDYVDIKKSQEEKDHKIDNRPMIGDTIPEDPFSNMFQGKNANANTTRIGDRR